MKRTELTAGQEVYWAESNNFMERRWARQGKAVVLMVAAEKVPGTGGRWGDPEYRPLEKGDRHYSRASVLVETDSEVIEGKKEKRLVPLAQLRGPYAETKAAAEKSWKDREAADRAVRNAVEKAQERASGLELRLARALGSERPYQAGVDIRRAFSTGAEITLTLDAAEKLLALLEAQSQGGTVQPDDQGRMHYIP